MQCSADINSEASSSHGDKTGVFHLDFDRAKLKALLEQAGFHDVLDIAAASMIKDIPGKGKKEFSVFLVIARIVIYSSY